MTAERRRTRRAAPIERIGMNAELQHRVKVLDISQSGALMSSDVPMAPGTRGRLRTGAPGCLLDLPFRVQRCKPAGFSQVWSVAARFEPLEDASRRALERLLQRASE